MFSILGILTGLAGPISAISGHIKDLQLAKINASNTSQRLAFDQEIAEASNRKAILVAEAGNRIAGGINATIRGFAALCAISVIWKLMFWDKVMGSFNGCTGEGARRLAECNSYRTDPLDVYQWSVITAVIAFYFGYDMLARSRKNV